MLGLLPYSFLLSQLDEGSDVEAALRAYNALYQRAAVWRITKKSWKESPKNRRWQRRGSCYPKVKSISVTTIMYWNSKKRNAASAKKLLKVLVFMKLRHSNWTRVSGHVHRFWKTWTTWWNWTPRTWSHRRPSPTEIVSRAGKIEHGRLMKWWATYRRWTCNSRNCFLEPVGVYWRNSHGWRDVFSHQTACNGAVIQVNNGTADI